MFKIFSMDNQDIIERIINKNQKFGLNTQTLLEGNVWAKPVTYWDYILPDALLSLQIQRTTLPDEMVFIMYHQINELLFKMILWEIDQVSACEKIEAEFFSKKLERISRYFDMLSESFNIMGDGMDLEQYNKFRNTLAPASGFQSAQYRLIEFASTELINLIDYRFRATIDRNTPYTHAFEHLYWQAAGKDYATGKKNAMLTFFEEKYKAAFAHADLVIIAGVFNPEDAKNYGDVLDVPKLVGEITANGTPAMTLTDADAIVAYLAPEMVDGDVVAVMSNGGFGSIHDKILEVLRH